MELGAETNCRQGIATQGRKWWPRGSPTKVRTNQIIHDKFKGAEESKEGRDNQKGGPKKHPHNLGKPYDHHRKKRRRLCKKEWPQKKGGKRNSKKIVHPKKPSWETSSGTLGTQKGTNGKNVGS